MPSKPKGYIFDTWSLLTFLEDDIAAEKIGNIIADSQEKALPLLLTSINASEIWFLIAKTASETIADECLKSLQDLGLKFVEIDSKLAGIAARFRLSKNLSLSDSLTIALLSQQKGFLLVTGNHDFEAAQDLVNILWINK